MTHLLKRLPLLALCLGVLFAYAPQASAQLVVVESQYRVVEVDRAENRIGVALPDANPGVEQTWVYIKPDTRGSMRHYQGDGLFRDEQLSTTGILDAAAAREGQLIKIHGGRDWDGSINAKAVWM